MDEMGYELLIGRTQDGGVRPVSSGIEWAGDWSDANAKVVLARIISQVRLIGF